MRARRYRLDGNVRRHGNVVVGGSPLKLFRLTDSGTDVIDQIAVGLPATDSTLVSALLDAGAIHPLADTADAVHTPADVTIVVPTFGPPEHTPDAAVVVDDGSVPAVAGATIRLDRNSGPGAARNAGLEHVDTPLVAFVDGDVEVSDGWMEALLPHFADDRVAAVAPRVTTLAGTSAIARYESAHSPLDLGPDPARVRAGTRVSYVPAAALVCRTEAIRAVGGFETGLRHGEDVDLVWRLDEAGWRVRYEPASVVHHDPRPDWSSWVSQRVGYGSSTAPLAARHPGALAPLRMNGWSITTWMLAMIGRPAVGAVVGIGSAAALVRKLPDVPAVSAFRLAALGNLRAGDHIAQAVRRVWWPILLVVALRSSVARRTLAAAALAARHPLVLADDVAYSLGVWRGMVTERTIDPIVPQVSSWPTRAAGPPAPSATAR